MAQGKPGSKRVIGLLGGSFNPAHAGHVHLTQEALKRLKLDEVWWLVAPQNPLKPKAKSSYTSRFASAENLAAKHHHIVVTDIEAREKTTYSIDTVRMLKRKFPRVTFIWLMGADNLAELHRWKQWQAFLDEIPIAVFDRAPFSHRATRTKAYLRLSRFLLKNKGIYPIPKPPFLWFFRMKRHPTSSTALRKHLENSAF